MPESEVSSTIAVLLEEIQATINQIDREWARWASNPAHEEGQALLDLAITVSLLRAKLKVLQDECSSRESKKILVICEQVEMW